MFTCPCLTINGLKHRSDGFISHKIWLGMALTISWFMWKTPWADVNDWTQQAFQRCFNVVFWLMRRRDVGQRQINVETTLRFSTLKFTTSNNIEPAFCISTLVWKTLGSVETTLSFLTSSFTTLVNVESTLWKWPLP